VVMFVEDGDKRGIEADFLVSVRASAWTASEIFRDPRLAKMTWKRYSSCLISETQSYAHWARRSIAGQVRLLAFGPSPMLILRTTGSRKSDKTNSAHYFCKRDREDFTRRPGARVRTGVSFNSRLSPSSTTTCHHYALLARLTIGPSAARKLSPRDSAGNYARHNSASRRLRCLRRQKRTKASVSPTSDIEVLLFSPRHDQNRLMRLEVAGVQSSRSPRIISTVFVSSNTWSLRRQKGVRARPFFNNSLSPIKLSALTSQGR